MRKLKKFFAFLVVLTLMFTLSVTVYAHTWPENPGDWTAKDWEAWNNYWYQWQQYYKNQNCTPYYDPYYNGIIYPVAPATTTNAPGNSYNYAYDYKNYNYYAGVLDVYDANTEGQAVILAKIIYLYGHGVASQTQQAAVGWAVMNSIDDSSGAADIGSIAPNFHYDASKPTRDDFGRDLMPLARDVIFRWKAGRAGYSNIGRVLPNGYDYVWSTGSTLTFRTTADDSGRTWGFSWKTPYAN